MTEWKPRSKYEVAPGLFIGSEIGDIDRVIKTLMKKWIEENDKDAFHKIIYFQKRREELLMPKYLRKERNENTTKNKRWWSRLTR